MEPSNARNNVVLPEPDGPTIPIFSSIDGDIYILNDRRSAIRARHVLAFHQNWICTGT